MMKKRALTLCFAVVLWVLSVYSVFAAGDMPRFVDWAELLSDEEGAKLQVLLDEISERQQTDIVVVTVNSLEGKSAMEYADDFYDEHGYGYGEGRDGILFLISMGERDWYITTAGYGISAVTDAGREYMAEAFMDDLSGGDYYAAFTIFAQLCDDYITQAMTGEPYDEGNLPEEPFEVVWNLITAFGVGFVIALIVTGFIKGDLKSVESRSGAEDYIKKGSMQLTRNSDLFLYQQVERRERPKEDDSDRRSGPSGGSETHRSSSGVTHGGGGGKF